MADGRVDHMWRCEPLVKVRNRTGQVKGLAIEIFGSTENLPYKKTNASAPPETKVDPSNCITMFT